MDPSDEKLLSDIAQYGWHAALINPEEEGAGYGFTVGFFRSYGHPEIFIYGLSHETTHQLMRLISVPVMAGRRFHAGTVTHDLANHPCAFVEVPRDFYADFFGYGLWYYRERSFPVLQLVWPDPEGNFPWDSDYDFRYEQPVLGTNVA